jgi:hypothetical protein
VLLTAYFTLYCYRSYPASMAYFNTIGNLYTFSPYLNWHRYSKEFILSLYHHPLAITCLFNDVNLLYNQREIPVGWPLYKMATLFWKTNVLIILTSCLCATDRANILGIFPMPSKSHMTVHSTLMKELARRGHQVTVFSPFPEKSPIQNFTDIEFKLSHYKLRNNSGEYKT